MASNHPTSSKYINDSDEYESERELMDLHDADPSTITTSTTTTSTTTTLTATTSTATTSTTTTTTSPVTPRMPVPFARVMSQELLRAPQINVSANRRGLAIIETPTSVNRSRNNGRLVYPRLHQIRRNLFDNKNERPPSPATEDESD